MRQMNALRMRIWTIKNFCLPDVTAAASFYEFSGILCIFYERRKGNFKTKTKGDFHFFLCLSSREKSSRLQINAKSHFYLQFDFYGIFLPPLVLYCIQILIKFIIIHQILFLLLPSSLLLQLPHKNFSH